MTDSQSPRRSARRLRHWLRGESSTLERIRGHARNLDRLERQLQRRLPDTLAGRWRLGGISADEVTLMAPTAAWAATLRFQQQLVLREIKQLTGIRARRCRVVVDPPRLSKRPTPRRTPSAATVNQLRDAAASQTDARLRESMTRLAERLASRRSRNDED